MGFTDFFRLKGRFSGHRKKNDAVTNDEKHLMDVVKNETNRAVRGRAVRKIKNQQLLAEIAKNNEDMHIRIAAIVGLNDQETLMDIVKNDSIDYVRKHAVHKITDQDFLLDLSKYDADAQVSRAALNELNSEYVQQYSKYLRRDSEYGKTGYESKAEKKSSQREEFVVEIWRCVDCNKKCDYSCPHCGAKACMSCMRKAKINVQKAMSNSGNSMYSAVGRANILGHTCPSCHKAESNIDRWGKRPGS